MKLIILLNTNNFIWMGMKIVDQLPANSENCWFPHKISVFLEYQKIYIKSQLNETNIPNYLLICTKIHVIQIFNYV